MVQSMNGWLAARWATYGSAYDQECRLDSCLYAMLLLAVSAQQHLLVPGMVQSFQPDGGHWITLQQACCSTLLATKSCSLHAETIGCEPSLSSIPVLEQRTLVDALKEVHAWLEANPGEFVVLYLDDQEDIARWVRGRHRSLCLKADQGS